MLTLLLVPRLSFQLAVTTLLLHRGHGGTTPEGEEAEMKFTTGLGIDGCPAKFRQAGDRTKYEEMKSVNLDVVSGERLAKLDDEVKMSWLMAKYGVMACLIVMVAMKTVSPSLTEGQACTYIYTAWLRMRYQEVMQQLFISSC